MLDISDYIITDGLIYLFSFTLQVVVYSSLPFTDLAPVKEPDVPASLQEIQLRHHTSSSDAVDVPTGTKGKHGGAKRTRLQEFLQKQRTVRMITKGRQLAQGKP